MRSRPAVDIFLGTGAIQVVKPGALVGLLKKRQVQASNSKHRLGDMKIEALEKYGHISMCMYLCIHIYIIYIVVDT